MKDRYVREIIAGFPYPIVAYFMKLGTDECLDPGWLRLKYILATAEAISRFLGIVVLCECRELQEKNSAEVPTSLVVDFEKKFKTPGWGNWTHFTREGLRWLDAHQVEQTTPELVSFYFKRVPAESSAASALGKLLTIRNGLSHEKIKAMHASDFHSLCEETYPPLEEVLEALDFLLNYELAFVSQIEVNKRRKRAPSFLHRFSRLIGSSDAFPGARETLDSFLDSSSILLIDTENRRHLNLDPLLIYEASAGKAPDIFFYNGLKKPGVAEYSGCHRGGNVVSTDSKRAEELGEEIMGRMD
ncbi:hypothetical protein ACFL0Q_08185, partial [Thermodesulfobacteriota bacterium]